MILHKIFQYNKWESVRAVIDACGRIKIRHLILVCKIQFLAYFSYEYSVIHTLFCALLSTVRQLYDVSFYS